MSKQRLIDAEAYKKCWKPGYFSAAICKTIDDQPTIKAETLPIVKELLEKLKLVTFQRNAAIDELGGVLATVDVLTDFVDDEVYPVVNYDLNLQLREKVDAVATWKHESKWRGSDAEKGGENQ